MKKILLISLFTVFLGKAAFAETNHLSCSFLIKNNPQNRIQIDGDFDGQVWNIENLNGDDTGYDGIQAKKSRGGLLSFFIDTAEETGGDNDYTEIYDITLATKNLKKGMTVRAQLHGDSVSRGSNPYKLTGSCVLN